MLFSALILFLISIVLNWKSGETAAKAEKFGMDKIDLLYIFVPLPVNILAFGLFFVEILPNHISMLIIGWFIALLLGASLWFFEGLIAMDKAHKKELLLI